MNERSDQMIRPTIRPVRLTLPASVAYDLSSLQKGLTILAERLGCPTCFSGADCTFTLERDFIINERLELNPVVGAFDSWRTLPQDPIPFHKGTATIPASVAYDINQIQELVASVASRLGHPACFSGFDFGFQQERDWVIDQSLNFNTRGQI